MKKVRVGLSCTCVITIPVCEWGNERWCARHRTVTVPVSLYAPPNNYAPATSTAFLW